MSDDAIVVDFGGKCCFCGGPGGTIDHIEINNLQDHTFFASIHIRQNGDVIEIDSRPSDAIALGIATTVPIFVAEHVLDEVC